MTKARILLLSSLLASQVSYSQTPVARQIEVIESRLRELRRFYTDSYPAVRQLQSQLQTLQAGRETLPAQVIETPVVSPPELRETLTRRIGVIESELIYLRRFYTESYPQVRQLQVQLQVLQTRRDALTK